MCFASQPGRLEVRSLSGSENECLLNDSQVAGWHCYTSPSFSTPTEPARCKPKASAQSGSPVSCGSWHNAWPLSAPCAGRSEAAAAVDSSMDVDQEGPADNVCILRDIVKGSLFLHSSLSLSTAGQAGSWYDRETEFVPCFGNSALMAPADSSSKCVQFINRLHKRCLTNNNLQCNFAENQASAWLPLGQENVSLSSSSLATASPPGATVPGRMGHARKATQAAPQSQVQNFEVNTSSNAVQGQLSYSNLQLQLKDWLEDMEANSVVGGMQCGGNTFGGLSVAANSPAATAACGTAQPALSLGLPAPAFVLLGLL